MYLYLAKAFLFTKSEFYIFVKCLLQPKKLLVNLLYEALYLNISKLSDTKQIDFNNNVTMPIYQSILEFKYRY